MVVALFPLAKIGFLLLKQFSKPMANLIINRAKRHPGMRKHVIIPIGRTYRWIENKALLTLTGAKPHEVEHVSEEEAVELGANAVGEIVLFGFLCLILLMELNRYGEKQAVIKQTQDEELMNLKDTVLELNDEINQLRKVVTELKDKVDYQIDVFDMEERIHDQITDRNFWDLLNASKKEEKLDKNTISVSYN